MEEHKKVDFDGYAAEYNNLLQNNLKFFDDHNYFAEYKVKIVRDIFNQNLVEPKNILEFGCGTGRNLSYFKKLFPNAKITGCDISAKSLEIAKLSNPEADFFNLDNLDNLFKSADFKKHDLIFIAGVFHHIEPNLRDEVMKNIFNLLSPQGKLIIFEHNPFNPLTCKMVKDCPFDSDAVLLKPKELKKLIIKNNLGSIKIKYTLFFPKFLNFLRGFEKYLTWLPLGGQYYIFCNKK